MLTNSCSRALSDFFAGRTDLQEALERVLRHVAKDCPSFLYIFRPLWCVCDFEQWFVMKGLEWVVTSIDPGRTIWHLVFTCRPGATA